MERTKGFFFLQKNEKYFDVTIGITLKRCYDTDIRCNRYNYNRNKEELLCRK